MERLEGRQLLAVTAVGSDAFMGPPLVDFNDLVGFQDADGVSINGVTFQGEGFLDGDAGFFEDIPNFSGGAFFNEGDGTVTLLFDEPITRLGFDMARDLATHTGPLVDITLFDQAGVELGELGIGTTMTGPGNLSSGFAGIQSDEPAVRAEIYMHTPGAPDDRGELFFMDNIRVVGAATETGDFNGDHVVDGADFLLWQRNVGDMSGESPADGNMDDVVDEDDLAIWASTFGDSLPEPEWAAVPEAGSLVLALWAGGIYVAYRRLSRCEIRSDGGLNCEPPLT